MNDPEIIIRLPLSKLNVIMAALGERPLKEVVEVWALLRQQGEAQTASQATPEVPVAP